MVCRWKIEVLAVPDERVQQLIDQLRESDFVEVKNWLGGLVENDEKARLAKEIIALANSGGGHIFIGFTDDEGQGHNPIEPVDTEATAFSQDAIAAIVHRYCTPAIQCAVEIYLQTNGQIGHPVIYVPPAGRVPLFASRQSPDNRTLTNGTVYVRRPGGNSEPCRSQDDWERLLERLVHARQDQLINAIRNVLNPEQEFTPAGQERVFEDWISESRAARGDLLATLPEGHPLRLEQGNYEMAFSIRPFPEPDIAELNRNLDVNRPRHSGWAPFVSLHRDGMAPRPLGDVIQAWLVGEDGLNRDPSYSDFWRLSVHGDGYLVRAMQEDDPDYGSNLAPRPHRPGFDWELPIYRMTEMLKLIEWLGLSYASDDSIFQMRVTYFGTNGRRLTQHRLRYMLDRGGMAHEDSITSQISGRVGDIALNTEEMVFSILRPVFAQFDFAELPRQLVDNVVQDVEGYRQ